MPAETLDWIEAHQFYRNTPNNDRDIKYVPIQFHIVGTSQGTGYFPANDVFRLLCQLNEKYIPVGDVEISTDDKWFSHNLNRR